MQVNNITQNTSFNARIKLQNIDASLDKMAKDLGCDKSLLEGAASMSALSGSAASLTTANYSGLEKVLPINVSIPLTTTATSSLGYKALVNKSREAAASQVKNAKRRGQEIPENTTDADFVKPITKNLLSRLKELFTFTKPTKGE